MHPSLRNRCLTLAATITLLSLNANSEAQQDPAARAAAAQVRAADLARRVTRAVDINAIENLQRSYGFYVDKMLWDEVVDLFSDNGTMEIGPSGVYVGKQSIRRYLYSLSGGQQGPLEGELYNHMQLQPIVTLAEDGLTAQGRWRAFILTGTSGSGSGGKWGDGPYENDYVKQGGVWKISKLHWYATFMSPYEGGWKDASEQAVREYAMGKGVEPDRPSSEDYRPFPGAYVPPFHYPNPVTTQTGEAP